MSISNSAIHNSGIQDSAWRVLLVTDNASFQLGGESALPLHYYRVLQAQGCDVRLLVHARNREEIEELPEAKQRVFYTEDTMLQHVLWWIGHVLPRRVAVSTTGFLIRLITQWRQRNAIRALLSEREVDVIHQPYPVSPLEPSLIYGFDAPVVIGPMNGGIDFPPAQKRRQGVLVGLFMRFGRRCSGVLNTLLPGKRRAALLLSANERTSQALAGIGLFGSRLFVENGVDLSIWRRGSPKESTAGEPVKFAYMGALLDWKAVDLLVRAAAIAAQTDDIVLTIIGDGPERQSLENQVRLLQEMPASREDAVKIEFTGWLSQQDCARQLEATDALVLPSLMECGGAVVLEAMAMELPVVATEWGGPADYIDDSCGILVPPSRPEAFVQALAHAMQRLARSPELRQQMGKAGREKVLSCYDWDVKGKKILDFYSLAIAAAGTESRSKDVLALSDEAASS